MEFENLDIESEKLLKKLLLEENVLNKNVAGTAIEYLVKNNYIDGISARTGEDKEPVYIITGITQKGKCYFEQKRNHNKDRKKLSRREWGIAIVSAIIGSLIGLIPTILQIFDLI